MVPGKVTARWLSGNLEPVSGMSSGICLKRVALSKDLMGCVGRRVSGDGRKRSVPDEGRRVFAASVYLLKQDVIWVSLGAPST